MTFLSFIARASVQDASAASRITQAAVFGIPTLLAFASPYFGISFLGLPWWGSAIIALGAFLLAIMVGIIWRSYLLDLDLQPKIKISDPMVTTWPKGTDVDVTRYFSIEIENLSFDHIRGCRVEEISFTNVFDQESEITGRVFHLGAERYANPSEHQYEATFDLKGKGDRKRVDIVNMYEGDDKSLVFMAYATSSTARTPNAIPRRFFPHKLIIQVTADNLRVPRVKAFKIDVDHKGRLIMESKWEH